jgi:hypothetical protein
VTAVSMDLEFTILLPGGGVFHFSGPFPVSGRQWDHVRAVMDAMAPGLVTTDDHDTGAHTSDNPVADHGLRVAGQLQDPATAHTVPGQRGPESVARSQDFERSRKPQDTGLAGR